MTGSVPVSELEDLRDHYDRGWVDEKTQGFIDRLDSLIDRYQDAGADQ